MDISPDSTILNGLRYQDLTAYLELTGWRPTKPTSSRWIVFVGAQDADGGLLEVVLPQDRSAKDLRIYLASCLSLLSALREESPERVVKRVKNYDRDILQMRDLETDTFDSIPLQLASQQVYELRQLVSFGASSEDDPRPHFNSALAIGRKMAQHYRFGHTFPGSFGFTIESQVANKLSIYEQEYKQTRIEFPDLEIEEKLIELPLERRVMERIVRGLLIAQAAAEQRDASILIRSYPIGFNSKMCDAIVKMSQNKTMVMEYDVLWSPKIEPSDDIRNLQTIRIGQSNYGLLEDAAEELSRLEPQLVTISGLVTHLTAKDDPRASDAARSVIIKRMDQTGKRFTNIAVALERDDYATAIEAHKLWNTVQISGSLEKVRNGWRLSNPHNFQVTGKFLPGG